MKFQAFKNERIHTRAADALIEKAGEREWVTPNGGLLFSVRVTVFNAIDMAVSFDVSRWKESAGDAQVIGGRAYTGGYFDFVRRPLDIMAPLELEWAAFAKLQLQRWIDGHREDLPEQLWEFQGR